MKKVIFYLVFAISALAGQAQDPAIVMTTAKSINSQFTFGIQAAAPNTPIQIDWGNGVKENFTIGNSLEFFNYPLKGNSVKIWGEGITNLNVASMELTALDVTRATSLTYLYIKTNKISTLDLSNCTALTYVDCSVNLLNSLNLPNTSTLVGVNCANNKLTFVTLPTKQPTWTSYTYSPQQNFALPKQTYSTNEEIDLSSQLNVDSQTTTYTWKTESGTTLVNGTDYNENGGKFTFLKTFLDSLYCEMTNAAFPDLILTTTKISIPQLPNVLMTTTSAVGSTFTFGIGATESNTPIKVDWGNGVLASYTIGENTTVSGTLAGSTIKIYGTGISYLDLSEKKLTSLDVTNNNTLTKLYCSKNQLTTLDVSKSNSLKELYCNNNSIASLDVSNLDALRILHCFSNGMNNLTIDGCNSLETLYCYYNNLTSLNTSSCPSLKLLYCTGNKIVSLDVSENLNLTELGCTDNMLTSLDLSRNTKLELLGCSNNQLTNIDLQNNPLLYRVHLANNQLTQLNLANNPLISRLDIPGNWLTFATLPIATTILTNYIYSPQRNIILPKTEYTLNEEVDLSSQLTAGGNTTTYTWKTAGGKTLVKDSDYTENNGKFTFLKQPCDYFYCEMRNATFPELTLVTENIFITQTEPSVTMTTTSAVGSTFTFGIGATSSNTPIKVDWGNGILASYTIGEYTTVSGTLADSTIKIYGVGIMHLDLWGKNLTSLDVSSNKALKHLNCNSNKLTTLDVTNNTELTDLNCSSNQLSALDVTNNSKINKLYISYNKFIFTTLPIKQASWTTYTYSPQAKLILPKTEYVLNEEIDLSSQLTAGGNTTVYTWKTAGGKTLVKDSDYTENNGNFRFLKPPLDYFYCEMRNAAFPELILTTEYISIFQNKPFLSMTTSFSIGSTFTFGISATAPNASIQVDWGDGILSAYTIGEYSNTISGTLSGNSLKIYGLGIDYLDLSYKNLKSLDVSGIPTLKSLYCDYNFLNTIDISKNIELKNLSCDVNKINALDVSKNDSLKYLSCWVNNLRVLDVTNNIALLHLNCGGNPLTYINVTNNKKLTALYCSSIYLRTLDVSNNSALTALNCSMNQLTTLDVSNNSSLRTLDCHSNQITDLDLTNNTALRDLTIYNNKFSFSTLPVKQASWTSYSYSPQLNINLPKKQYGLTETVDLSSESTINGNATNYVWKTKGGSTLTAGTDYNVTNGVTTFLKVQPDSVYCEMTNASFPDLTLKTSSIKVSQFPLSVPNSRLSASIFPNPASEFVNIELNENIFRVEIFNSLGIKLLEQETNIAPRVVLHLNNIPAGILIVRAYTKNGFTENKIVKL